MLDLVDFKKEFISQCQGDLCSLGSEGMYIEERKVNKAQRGMLNGILFMKEGLNCAPTFYIEDFYKAYKGGTTIAELSHQAIDTAIRSLDMANMLAQKTLGMINNKDNLRVRMLNKTRNKEYLKNIPYKEEACGFVYIAESGHDEYGAVVTRDILKDYKMSEDELFDKALKNTIEHYPAVLYDLYESAMDIKECKNLLEYQDSIAPEETGPGYVLTNSGFYWGAGALFYPGVIDRIHELLAGDFYVMPASVHELIIVAADGQDAQELVDTVRSANRSIVYENDILADDLYICREGTLRRVSYGGVIPPFGELLN